MVQPPSDGKGEVLMLAYHYPPSSSAGAARPFHLSKYLPQFGYPCHVLTAAPQLASQPRARVHHVPVAAPPDGRRSLGRLAEMCLRKFLFPYDEAMLWSFPARQAARKLLAQADIRFVFSTFPPINTHLAALMLKKRFGLRWIADFRDPLVNCPGRLISNLHRKAIFNHFSLATDRWLENRIVRNADLVIANTSTLQSYLCRRYPWATDKIVCIWNGFDSEDAPRAAPITPRPHRVIAHIGGIYHARHPGAFLASADRLIRQGRLDPHAFRIQLVGLIEEGSIPDDQLFARLVAAGCLEYTGSFIPQDQARRLLQEADYLLLLDVDTLDAGQQVPSKVFEYIPIGRPILAFTPSGSPTAWILSESGIPHTIVSGNDSPEEVDEKVLSFLRLPTEPVPASEVFQQRFDAVMRAEQLARLLDCRFGSSPHP